MSPRIYKEGKPVENAVENHEHISPVSHYWLVFAALIVLTVLTVAVSYMNLGPLSLPVAILVATVKATLVCMYFMHLRYDDRFHVFVFVSTLLFVGIFFTFTLYDMNWRKTLHEEQDTFFKSQVDSAPMPLRHALPAVVEGHHGEGHGEGHGAEGHGEGEAKGAAADGAAKPADHGPGH
jgi:cytochrome c oxidase subunit 4